ncbi:MAG: hypothetical protein KFF73_16420 [Cyclobacteriaceae bacterium]|nr:hypothetical protein [Cyclobacteriaceae bacterium]
MSSLKKLLFVFGTLSLMLLSLSYLAFVLEWGSAGLLRVFGFILMALVLIAGALKQKSFIMYTGSIALLFVLLSFGFRAVGFPGVEVLLTAGIMIFTFVFLPMVGWWMYKHSGIADPGI